MQTSEFRLNAYLKALETTLVRMEAWVKIKSILICESMSIKIEELSVKRQILAFLKGFCEKANFGQNSAKICLCSQNLPFHRIIETCLKTGIFVPSGTPSTF